MVVAEGLADEVADGLAEELVLAAAEELVGLVAAEELAGASVVSMAASVVSTAASVVEAAASGVEAAASVVEAASSVAEASGAASLSGAVHVSASKKSISPDMGPASNTGWVTFTSWFMTAPKYETMPAVSCVRYTAWVSLERGCKSQNHVPV